MPRPLLLLSTLALSSTVHAGLLDTAAGMSAQTVCNGLFLAQRPQQSVLEQDLYPSSALLKLASLHIDDAQYSVTAKLPLGAPRTARWLPGRGCVLDAPPAAPGTLKPEKLPLRPTPWPQGDAAIADSAWPAEVDKAGMLQLFDALLAEPLRGQLNTRSLVLVYRGQLLAERHAPGFDAGTPQLGWSMSKTITGLLAWLLAGDKGIRLDAPLVSQFGEQVPPWVDAWRRDARAAITLDDLLHMRDGLAHEESYEANGDVPSMLWGGSDIAARAADAAPEARPGQRWRYSSASTELLAAALRPHFASNSDYLAYPRQRLFAPLGARSMVMGSDASGHWAGSSMVWATAGDWARLGQLLLQDGQWQGKALLPAGYGRWAMQAALPQGDGLEYGAQLWRGAWHCPAELSLPADTMLLSGHWGQLVAAIPSRQVVMVRTGWKAQHPDMRFSQCQFIYQVLRHLPQA